MFQLALLSLLISFGVILSTPLHAQDGGGGIASGVSFEVEFVASVRIGSHSANNNDTANESSTMPLGNASITLILIDQSSNTSPFVLSIWAKSSIDHSKLGLIVIDDHDAVVDVLQTDVQVCKRADGQLVTFTGSLTKDCTRTSRIHVVQFLSSKGFCEPYLGSRTEDVR